ncbi:adenylate/guanylate cyclase domain-containing protein [Pararhizobium sp. YC-54]|uniref:adenylate/guanylate cyclase domain-containing protein n=1 Tax=Pararhizobium sp. YC-54 TaxID=2986920 RepID=UPI0021F6CDEE|nr:adenylate/guanylate cyclase domain-containing protein [Pararhizobium sp. YC-54]MCV9997509.1 adenylate/guanylate cyclase domain-containing protein [Pararhizobium sp. YC-54]
MSETQRKLTTIFCADVQDYTRLMGADEEGTLAMLKHYRDAMSRLIDAHGGRVINTWGDGVIAEFPSVVECLRAAMDVQNELAGRNAARPADGRMLFRIGINLGDVIVDGDDIYGDGVNIAARLQASAAAGGIVISNTVYDQVRNKVAVSFDFLGPLPVKNIADAVPSYAVRIGGGTSETPLRTDTTPSPAPQARPGGDAGTRSDTKAATPMGQLAAIARPMLGIAGLAVVVLIAINALSWRGVFWSVWPVLGLAVLSALVWVSVQARFDRFLAALGVIGLGIAGINVLTWHGVFWSGWPLLGIGIVAALYRIIRR